MPRGGDRRNSREDAPGPILGLMPDLLGHLRTSLAGRYHIDRELGRGGMAVVFLATDAKHGRRVALKVLRPELAESLGAERFVREIEIAARLSHPHVLALYDSGDAGGFLFYAMPFVEGETLRDRLERERQLPLADALQIAREVADALGYAHSLGVIHRDIKPENILFQAGHAVVSDFGIARAIDVAGGEHLTETGIAIGTPAYMSPEQASGEGRLDGRTDLYSLACVLYEMLGGQPPFTGPSAQAVLARHTIDPVPPLRTLRPTTPESVALAVETALAKVPADRHATAHDFVRALEAPVPPGPRAAPAPFQRRIRTGIGLAVGAALVAFAGWKLLSGPLGAPGSRQLAVLYLENQSGDSSNAYLADGITEEIINRLGQVRQLIVKSGDAVRRFRGSATGITEIGRTLGVSDLVTGRIDRTGGRLRVHVSLDAVAGDRHLWGDTYDLGGGDVLAIEDQIAQAVAGEIVGRLAPADSTALVTRPTNNRQAYDHYLKGNFYLARRTSASDGRHALDEYQAALKLDPNFAAAYGRMGLDYGIWANWPWPHPGLTKDSVLALGLAAANRAIALDSSSADGWLARGFLLIPTPGGEIGDHGFSLDPVLLGGAGGLVCPPHEPNCTTQALRALRRAIRLEPRNAEIWYQYGRAELVDAFEHHRTAPDSSLRHSLTLAPDRAVSAWLLAVLHVQAHHWNLALRYADSSITLGRRDPSIRSLRLAAHLGQGNVSAARADADTMESMLAQRPATDTAAAAYGAALQIVVTARAGDTAQARRALAAFVAHYHPDETSDPLITRSAAAAFAATGDRDHAFSMLERLPPGSFWITFSHPVWDAMRTDPRFQAMLDATQSASHTPRSEES